VVILSVRVELFIVPLFGLFIVWWLGGWGYACDACIRMYYCVSVLHAELSRLPEHLSPPSLENKVSSGCLKQS